MIDAEVRRILQEHYDEAVRLLGEHRRELDALAEALLEHETLEEEEILAVTGLSNRAQPGIWSRALGVARYVAWCPYGRVRRPARRSRRESPAFSRGLRDVCHRRGTATPRIVQRGDLRIAIERACEGLERDPLLAGHGRQLMDWAVPIARWRRAGGSPV